MPQFVSLILLFFVCRAFAAGEQSIAELRTKALEGDVRAQMDLGGKYDAGQSVRQDFKEAFKWYEMAAKAGDPLAQNNLGDFFLRGEGVKKNQAKALQFFQQAFAQNTNSGAAAAAACSIGLIYDDGLGVPQDKKEANVWYLKAAEAGSARAMHNLGLSYTSGSGVDPNPATAFYWFEKAAALGFAKAQLKTGFALYNGIGTTQDAEQALVWYHKAASHGNVEAIANIGIAYRDGKGVNVDVVESFAWLDLARFMTQNTGNMRTKWSIRGELDLTKQRISSSQIRAGEARTKKLYEELSAHQPTP